MIIVTGAAGFIGSCMVRALNDSFHSDLVLVDDWSKPVPYLRGKHYRELVDLWGLSAWLDKNGEKVRAVIHIGANSSTVEKDWSVLERYNLDYTKMLWRFCAKHQIKLLYASSAATYGDGELGFDDSHEVIESLKPLNLYGKSKNEFDKWALMQRSAPSVWAGFKYFNVYGPNEYHKGRMASMVFHSYNQICKDGKLKLFKSHKKGYGDGGQLRDLVYVKDIVRVMIYFLHNIAPNGIYNVGTGKARSFADLGRATFAALNRDANIEYIDMPMDLRKQYQYFTEAKMDKLRAAGYIAAFTSLEEGVRDYVVNYLMHLPKEVK